jgi:hypothetical protein
MPPFQYSHPDNAMEAERLNQLDTKLADLASRTKELRGYL